MRSAPATRPARHGPLATLVCALLVLALLLPPLFLIAEAAHDCTGEDCPVCACVRAVTTLIEKAASGSPTSASAPLAVPLVSPVHGTAGSWHPTTLHELGVRLNL